MRNTGINRIYKSAAPVALLPAVIILFGCGVEEKQSNFEDAALSPPHGITEMTATGVPVEKEKADPSDWRISPRFRGLVEIQTAPFPNPVSFNGTIQMNLYITGIQAVNGLRVFVFRPNTNKLSGPYYTETGPLRPGFETIRLSAKAIAQRGTGTKNLYRIVIYDGQRNIITYGDIKVIQ